MRPGRSSKRAAGTPGTRGEGRALALGRAATAAGRLACSHPPSLRSVGRSWRRRRVAAPEFEDFEATVYRVDATAVVAPVCARYATRTVYGIQQVCRRLRGARRPAEALAATPRDRRTPDRPTIDATESDRSMRSQLPLSARGASPLTSSAARAAPRSSPRASPSRACACLRRRAPRSAGDAREQGRRARARGAQQALRGGQWRWRGAPSLLLSTLSARFSFPTLSSSIDRFSYGAYPATSRITERTNSTRLFSFCARQRRRHA